MQNEAFHNWISNPDDLRAEDLPQIESMLASFPWFTPLRLLHLKGLHQHKSYQFGHALKRTSIQTPDREQLYELIYASKLRQRVDEIDTTYEEEPIEVVTEVATEAVIEPNETDAPEPSTLHFGQMLRANEPAKKAEEIVEEKPEEKVDEKSKQNSDFLEKTILQHAISSGFVLEYGSSSELDESEKESDKNKRTTLDEKETKKPSQFSEWLLFIEDQHKESQKPKPEVETEIIENFITKGSEKLSKSKNDHLFTPTNMSKLNLVEDEAFVTETLANIFAKQGNFPKAIRAYQALMLKYPEKKAYFAALIKEIEQKK